MSFPSVNWRTLKLRGIFALFGASALVVGLNYHLYKFGNNDFKAHYTHFKFANTGFYPSDELCNGADSEFKAADVGFKVIYRILEFGNGECNGAGGGCEASCNDFKADCRTVIVDNMSSWASCKRVEFGIDGWKWV